MVDKMTVKDKLKGERITLRSYRNSDLAFVSEMWFDKENGKYLCDPEWDYIDENFVKAVSVIEYSEWGYYFVAELNDTRFLIGSCCAFQDEKNKESYDIGYCIHKFLWRQGFGVEIVSLLLDWIKSRGGKSVTAEAAKENEASCALLKKLGFEVEKEAEFKKYNMGISYKSFIFGKTLN